MPFIPNSADAATSGQASTAAPDSVDFQILLAGFRGDGVLSGCAVTAQGTPDMTVAVAAGEVRVADLTTVVASGNVTIGANATGNPRFDLVVSNNAGVKSVVAGTAAVNPVLPALPANSVALAAVLVVPSAASIANTHIVDKRVTVNPVRPPFFGSAAPANPYVGQFWHDTDEAVVRMWNGTTWVGVTGGGGYTPGGTDVAIADGGTGASDAPTARTNLGLGTIATQAASGVAITGGSITGITDLAVADGGTGSSTAAAARTALDAQKTIATGSTAPSSPAVGDLWLDES